MIDNMSLNEIPVIRTRNLKSRLIDEKSITFGTQFTDYMFLMKYSCNKQEQKSLLNHEPCWHSAQIIPYQEISIDPACSGLHYGQIIWEGLKCYRTPEGKIQLFRPRDNLKRLNFSAQNLCMPPIDIEFILLALKKLLKIDIEWVPHLINTSLYIRPIMFASQARIKVQPSDEYLFYIILSPAGFYFKGGFRPITIMVESFFSRTTSTLGQVKCSGNYAASLQGYNNAVKKGYDQVLWLDGRFHKYIEELGTMNVFFKIDGKIYTPPLNGGILPGITRDSILQLIRKRKISIFEQLISIEEIIDAIKKNKLEECFGTGTACVITPVGKIIFENIEYFINNNQVGALSTELYEELTGIQYGLLPDSYGWVEKVD